MGIFYKKVFLEISQNSQENTSARVSFLTKLQAAVSGRDYGIGVLLKQLTSKRHNLFLESLHHKCLTWS